jgi:glycosyltransferase involved in cell wall biosynthesis
LQSGQQVMAENLKKSIKDGYGFDSTLGFSEDAKIREEGGLRIKGHIKELSYQIPLISVITVVFNGENYLAETIRSVLNQTYENIEYIIIDGGSSDKTVDIIKKHEGQIDYWVSEKDKGIYDAMNKGIDLSNGEWINFMNAGDNYADKNVLFSIFGDREKSASDFIYSDTIMARKGSSEIFNCSFENRRFIHQSIIYKTKVHLKLGKYLVAPEVTISDYLFFMQSSGYIWEKVPNPISIIDTTGVSSNLRSYLQKNAVDLIFGRINRIESIILIALHPVYHKVKKLFKRLM